MSNDPRYPGDDDPEGNKKTRLVMRPDVAEGGGSDARGSVIGTTRLVGLQGQPAPAAQPGLKPQAKTQFVREGAVDIEPVAGWIVVVKGPGRGGFRPVYVGMNSLGRAPSQRICLDFGDEGISREEHAFITYDDEQRVFYLQHGGKSNLVRLGNMPVLQPTELRANDLFRIGNTTLRFVPCCGPDFNWSDEVNDA
ncbi:MAG TPA: FHA domain-containing protein [Hyphomicrobium sp.]|nr:FHA domain-containing protein [Hyphomicrobium sp.]